MIDNPAKKKGTWAWLLQRVTAVLIIVFLGTHIVLDHFSNLNPATPEEGMLSYDSIQERLAFLPILLTDYALLITAMFHGLNGLRMVGFDFVVNKTKRKLFDLGLWAAGIFGVIWGLAIFAPFLHILGY